MLNKLYIILILFVYTGCTRYVELEYKTTKIDNIEQVVHISDCHYKLFYVDPNTKEMIVKSIRSMHTTIIVDVPIDEPMYATISSNNRDWYNTTEIHIHDVKELSFGNTGGKYPKQQTPLIPAN